MDSRQLEMARNAGIHFPTILPLFDSPPDQKAMDEWVNAQLPQLKTIAQKIIKNIKYINFEKFMVQLQATINDFNKRNKEPYALWIAQANKKSREGCSDSWVASLALEYCGLRWPEAIVYTDDLPDYITRHPEIKNFLLLDDAAYSGNHLSSEFSSVYVNLAKLDRLHSLDINLFIGIPYMTQSAKDRVFANPRLKPQLLEHAHIEQMKYLFEKKELAYLQEIGFSIRNMGLTYFAHRFPDIHSILQHLLTGQNLIWGPMIMPAMKRMGYVPAHHVKDNKKASLRVIHTAEEWNKLVCQLFRGSMQPVPDIVPPYYLEYKRGKDALEKMLCTTTHGVRTSYALPERCSDAIKMLSDRKIAVDGTPFQIPKVSAEPSQLEEKQIQSDSAITSDALKEKEENTLDAIESAIKNHTYILGRGLWSGRCIEDKGNQYKVSTGARDIFNLIKNARTDQAQGKKIDESKIARDIRAKLEGKLLAQNGFFCMGARDESTATLHQRIFQITNNIDKRLQR